MKEIKYSISNDIIYEFNILQDKILKNKIVYLELMFPILFSYEENDEIYLSYVIDHDEHEKKLNVITTQIEDYSKIEKMIKANLSVFDLFDEEYNHNVNLFSFNNKKYISNKIKLGDPCDNYLSLPDYHKMDLIIEDLLPEDDFYFSPLLPNKCSLTNIANELFLIKEKHFIEKEYEILKLNNSIDTYISSTIKDINQVVKSNFDNLLEFSANDFRQFKSYTKYNRKVGNTNEYYNYKLK